MLQGIDLSAWQKTTPDLTGVKFVFIRATYGTVIDTMFLTHLANAKKAGVPAFAYHFGRGLMVPSQVNAFMGVVNGRAQAFALDLESDPNPMSPAEATTFIKGVQALGHKIGLYHSDSGFPELGQDWDYVADYSVQPRRPFLFWQYGPYHGVDGDWFNGTASDLAAFIAGDSMALIANSTAPAITRVTIPAGIALFTVSGASLLKTGQEISVSSVGQSGPFDLIIVTHNKLTQYALVKSTDVTGRTALPDPAVATLQSKIAAAKAALS